MVRMSVTLCVVLSVVVSGGGASVCAQPRPQVQLPDADGDGHPLFGNPQIRPGFEEIVGGQLRIGDATSVVFADLDGDGDLDAVVTNTGRTTVFYITVLINRGDGVFDPPVAYDAGAEPVFVVAGDFSGDGVPDLAVANASDNDVSIFINHGDGTFASQVRVAVGTDPRALATADFDGDGDADLASLNRGSNNISILINTGGGTFAPQRLVLVNYIFGASLVCGDLNGDGFVDFAFPGGHRVKLVFGDGLGGFALAAQHAPVRRGSRAVAMGDLDGDGDNDLVTVTSGRETGSALSVLFNDGSGLFGPAVEYSVATRPDPGSTASTSSVSLGDLEGDGDLDVAVGYAWQHLVSVFRNNGDGSLEPNVIYPVHPEPWIVKWADVNNDGSADLAVLATFVRSKLAILLSDGDGGLITQEETPPYFSSAGSSFPWISPTSVAAADLDGDGDQDMAVAIGAHQERTSVTIVFNQGDGVFGPIVPNLLGPVGDSWADHVVIADLNGDGIPDLAIADGISAARRTDDGKVWVLPGLGGGAFGAHVVHEFVGVFPTHLAPGDLDGDGDTDLAVWVSQVYPGNFRTPIDRWVVILSNDGTGAFAESGRYWLGAFTPLSIGSVVVGDFDQDGDLDLVASAVAKNLLNMLEPPGMVSFFVNDGGGVFSLHLQREMVRPRGLAMADFDEDGDLDVVVLSPHVAIYGEPTLHLIDGLGGGAFSEPLPLTDEHPDSNWITSGDVDRDGHVDLVMPTGLSTVVVMLGQGDSTFDFGVHYGTGENPRIPALADFDGDGRVDIVTANSMSNNVTLIRNLGAPPSPPCYADCDTSTGIGVLDMLDFLCFQAAFANADPYACDCDTSTGNNVCDIFDFLCFQDAFVAGCP